MEILDCDVVIIGSGAGGLLAAVHAHDLGLKPVVIEKTSLYGGTSAISGGAIWVPSSDYVKRHHSNADELSMDYLRYCTAGQVPDEKLAAYIRYSAELVPYLSSIGVEFYMEESGSYPDYYQEAPGALPMGRTLYVESMDGRVLGDDLYMMRDSLPEFKVLDRISLSITEAGAILARLPGWRRIMAKRLFSYYTDFRARRRSARDRHLNLGAALVGGLRVAMRQRNIPLHLQTRMQKLLTQNGRVTGVLASQRGRPMEIRASRGVILASGGFEQNQELRSKYFPQQTDRIWSVTPGDCNTGDGLLAAEEIGAATEFLDEAWWAPTFTTPLTTSPSFSRSAPVFFERGYPHSLCVNRLGKRFTNEICSYHQFGQAMMKDNLETGSNMPCWIVFDSNFRRKYTMAGLLPSYVMPDSAIPPGWLDSLIFRADSIEELAGKISIDPATLRATVERFNGFAKTGVDEDFGRGSNVYNRFFGDYSVKPNQNLGPLEKGPYYAIALNLGDIGSKGGPKTNEHANVLDREGRPIEGLYATGNVAGSVAGGSYPGAGATLGPAMTFAYVATAHIAGKAG